MKKVATSKLQGGATPLEKGVAAIFFLGSCNLQPATRCNFVARLQLQPQVATPSKPGEKEAKKALSSPIGPEHFVFRDGGDSLLWTQSCELLILL